MAAVLALVPLSCVQVPVWASSGSSVSMYRLYDRYTGEHFYTSDVSERDHLVSVGWSYEGVGWRSGGSVPVYRQYNPYARTGTHNYTADGSENDRLVSVGSGTPVAPSSPVLGSYLRDELALDGADGMNLQIDWFDPSRARVTYLWEGMSPWLLYQTSSRRVSGGWDISDRLATYQFRTDNNKAALQELDHYAKSADGLVTVNGRQPVDFDVNNTGPYTINRGDSFGMCCAWDGSYMTETKSGWSATFIKRGWSRTYVQISKYVSIQLLLISMHRILVICSNEGDQTSLRLTVSFSLE